MNGVHGSGRVGITDVAALNERGEETYIISHGTSASFRIRYVVRDRDFEGKAQVVVALKRDGIHDVCRFITRDLVFRRHSRRGAIHLNLPKVGLANGRYAVTVMIAKDGYFDQDQFIF